MLLSGNNRAPLTSQFECWSQANEFSSFTANVTLVFQAKTFNFSFFRTHDMSPKGLCPWLNLYTVMVFGFFYVCFLEQWVIYLWFAFLSMMVHDLYSGLILSLTSFCQRRYNVVGVDRDHSIKTWSSLRHRTHLPPELYDAWTFLVPILLCNCLNT